MRTDFNLATGEKIEVLGHNYNIKGIFGDDMVLMIDEIVSEMYDYNIKNVDINILTNILNQSENGNLINSGKTIQEIVNIYNEKI